MNRVGIIGLGLLGSAIAERLALSGFHVTGFDTDASRAAVVGNSGIAFTAATSSREVAAVCSRIVLSLPNCTIVAQVLDELLPALTGRVVIDTTTSPPDSSRLQAIRVAEHGGQYLDATVVGSSEQVRLGDAIVLVGGPAEAVSIIQPVLQAFSRQQFATGPSGSGATAKLITNLVLGLNRAVLAEALNLSRCCGLDLNAMLEILRSGAAWSRVMDTKGEKMIRGDFSPQARLDQHARDVGLILDLGRQAGAALPLSRLHQQLLSSASALGYGALDNSAILKAFEAGDV